MSHRTQHSNRKNSPCLLCDSSIAENIYQKDKWRYLQCKRCGLVSIDPKPSQRGVLNNYETYLPTDIQKIKKWEKMMRPVIDASVKIIKSRTAVDHGKILDIGCGFGFFLNAMKQQKWEVSGIEISKDVLSSLVVKICQKAFQPWAFWQSF